MSVKISGVDTLGITYNGEAANEVWVAFPLCSDNYDYKAFKVVQDVARRHIDTGLVSRIEPYPVGKGTIAGYDAKYPKRILFWVDQIAVLDGKSEGGFKVSYNITLPTSTHPFHPKIQSLEDLGNILKNALKSLDPATSTKISLVSALT